MFTWFGGRVGYNSGFRPLKAVQDAKMFSKTLTQTGHTRCFSVHASDADGWEVSIEQDSHVIRRRLYTDWHRLERALESIRREVAALEDQGWRARHGDGVSGLTR